ncbi:sulfate transporter, partial [Tabrizicola sp. SY72]|nr:sulfate transporter [Tabrizicola sp. SY72]
MTVQQTKFEPHPVPDGIVEANGNRYMADGKGGLRAVENVPA